MTKKTKKETKVPQRRTELDRIVTQLRTALRRESENVIKIGNLLIECRKHVPHGNVGRGGREEQGGWQGWLAENFDLSYRTARRYERAAEYVAGKLKSDTVADFANLSPTVLYMLAEGDFNERVEAAILAASRERRIDVDAALDAVGDDHEDGDEDGDEDGHDSDDEKDAESEAILDGPPPAVPPPAPNPPPTDFALRDFDEAISTLDRLKTKQSTQFAQTTHSANDLESVEAFIHAVMKVLGQI